ncbi:hypothetical protein FFWV33_12540 [Flavobacterium faecale]|uniref:Uncharacterized protein n=2 Tax=Flavobacterium faecale TaxID=1355330 RepID=A0A2S1LEX8_9FLAO|nr:hypothetical protein FFWV33_12540 [Flavobacterium faecale]
MASSLITAQLSPKVIKKFPASMLNKIYDISTKTVLTEDQQFKIGNKLIANDSLANLSVAKGEPIANLKNYYPTTQKLLTGILSDEQLDAYQYKLDNKNRFLLALKSAKKLELTTQQIIAIRAHNQLLDFQNMQESVQKQQFYNQKLDTILNQKQFAMVINLVYTDKSKEEADNDWKNIQKLKLVAAKDSSLVHRQLLDYYIGLNSYIDSSAKKFDAKKSTEIKNLIVLEKQPPVLTRFNILSDFIYKINIFSLAIQFEKELNLNTTQIDSLLSKYKELEIMKYKDKATNVLLKKTDTYTLFENTAIASILDPQQIEKLLANKNKKNAIQIAQEKWSELENKGLTKGQDQKTVTKQFAMYQLRYLMVSDQLKMNKSAVNMFKKRDIELKKPDLLKQLDSIKRNEKNTTVTKSQLKW